MKIMIVYFHVWDVGGVNSIILGLMDGFKKAGHEVDFFHASKKGRLRTISETEDVIMGKRVIRLASKQVAHLTKEDGYRFRHLVSTKYDMVIFCPPCPHEIKTSGVRDDKSWKQLFDVDKPVFVVFPDNLWNRYYKWLIDVNDYISGCFYCCCNAKHFSLKEFPNNHTFLFSPVDTSDSGLYRKRKTNEIVWLPQWKRWKGIKPFLESIPDFDNRLKINMYNIGIDYYNFKKKNPEFWQKIVKNDFYEGKVYNKKAIMDYHSIVVPNKIQKILKKSTASVDLSGSIGGDNTFRGLVTCGMIEAMLYGCVSVVHKSIVKDKRSAFYERDDIVHPISLNSMAKNINSLMLKKPNRIENVTRNALEYVRKYHDSQTIVEKIVIPFYKKVVKGKIKRPKKAEFFSDYKKYIEEGF